MRWQPTTLNPNFIYRTAEWILRPRCSQEAFLCLSLMKLIFQMPSFFQRGWHPVIVDRQISDRDWNASRTYPDEIKERKTTHEKHYGIAWWCRICISEKHHKWDSILCRIEKLEINQIRIDWCPNSGVLLWFGQDVVAGLWVGSMIASYRRLGAGQPNGNIGEWYVTSYCQYQTHKRRLLFVADEIRQGGGGRKSVNLESN